MISAHLILRNRFVLFALVPAGLVFVTTIAALLYNLRMFFMPTAGTEPKPICGSITAVLLALSVLVLVCSIRVIIRHRSGMLNQSLTNQR